MDNIINLNADEKMRAEAEAHIKSMFGPEHRGSALIIEGRAIPGITIRDCGDTIDFVLDGRFAYEFPREIAAQAASFAAQAMAIGAGYPWLGAPSKERPFAPQCTQVVLEPTP